MTLTEMIADVYARLGIGSTANARLDSTAITGRLNEAYQRLAADSGCFSRTVTLTTSSGVSTFTLPADVYAVEDVRYASQTYPLTKTTVATLSGYLRNWRGTTAGTPTKWYLLTGRTLGLHPAPSANGANVYIDAYVTPIASASGGQIPLLVNGSDEPTIPVEYHRLLPLRAVYVLASQTFNGQDGMLQAAERATEEYLPLYRQFLASDVARRPEMMQESA